MNTGRVQRFTPADVTCRAAQYTPMLTRRVSCGSASGYCRERKIKQKRRDAWGIAVLGCVSAKGGQTMLNLSIGKLPIACAHNGWRALTHDPRETPALPATLAAKPVAQSARCRWLRIVDDLSAPTLLRSPARDRPLAVPADDGPDKRTASQQQSKDQRIA